MLPIKGVKFSNLSTFTFQGLTSKAFHKHLIIYFYYAMENIFLNGKKTKTCSKKVGLSRKMWFKQDTLIYESFWRYIQLKNGVTVLHQNAVRYCNRKSYFSLKLRIFCIFHIPSYIKKCSCFSHYPSHSCWLFVVISLSSCLLLC